MIPDENESSGSASHEGHGEKLCQQIEKAFASGDGTSLYDAYLADVRTISVWAIRNSGRQVCTERSENLNLLESEWIQGMFGVPIEDALDGEQIEAVIAFLEFAKENIIDFHQEKDWIPNTLRDWRNAKSRQTH